MDRRESLKKIAIGTVGTAAIAGACAPDKKPEIAETPIADEAAGPARLPEEIKQYKKLVSEQFFTEHELKTIAVLSDIIIPKDELSGSATEAGVPEFIEFIVKDMPHHQIPMRGGLMWLDAHSARRFEKDFTDLTAEQRISIVDEIAYPEKAKPEVQQGVAFFNRMRDLTATGFFTTKMGVKDLGYMGNTPNKWNGVPPDVLDQYGLAYDERTLKESIQFDPDQLN